MKTWAKFYDWVMPDLPGMPPSNLVDLKLREAATTLCTKGRVHRNTLDPIDAVAGQPDYDLETDDPQNLEVVEIREVWFDGRRLTPKSAGQLATWFGRDWHEQGGSPKFYLGLESPKVLTLVRIPEADLAAGIRVEAVFAPSLEAKGVTDWVFDQWATDIATGAKALLMSMSKKPWTDLQMAAVNAAAFQGVVDEEGFKAQRGFARARRNTRSRYF